ncbi:hypothetical protein ACOSQ2_003376 [Xanthoceras sorbifolium]
MLDSRVQSWKRKSSEKIIILELDKSFLSKHKEEMSDCLERLKEMKEELMTNKDKSLKIFKEKELEYLEELKKAKEMFNFGTLYGDKRELGYMDVKTTLSPTQGVDSSILKKKTPRRQPQAQGKVAKASSKGVQRKSSLR